MAQNISLLGANYSAVPAVTLPKQGGGTARFDDCTVTTATASDVASGKVFIASDGTITTGTGSGGGGSSNFTLLNTKSLGTISTTNTSATDTGQTLALTNWNDYDLLVMETSVNTSANNRHLCTVRTALITGTSNISTKNTFSLATATLNIKRSSSGTDSSRYNATSYGVYVHSGTISGSTLTLTVYQRYNSTQTGTINGNYTLRVYGCKLYDLIGG